MTREPLIVPARKLNQLRWMEISVKIKWEQLFSNPFKVKKQMKPSTPRLASPHLTSVSLTLPWLATP
jgi:hypothetical protein